jgi:hypothetical protein
MTITATSTITELPDFDIEFTKKPVPAPPVPADPVPVWIDSHDGGGEWSDGWTGETPLLPIKDTYEAYIDSISQEPINDFPEDWAL